MFIEAPFSTIGHQRSATSSPSITTTKLKLLQRCKFRFLNECWKLRKPIWRTVFPSLSPPCFLPTITNLRHSLVLRLNLSFWFPTFRVRLEEPRPQTEQAFLSKPVIFSLKITFVLMAILWNGCKWKFPLSETHSNSSDVK